MENEKIKKMFQDAAENASKDSSVSDDSIAKTTLSTNIDHDVLCPFRSLDISECPLCKINR
jgi:hypothetical protein